jgi:hypothetical protein
MIEILQPVDAPPEMIYAFEKTGRIVTSESTECMTDAELDEWDRAIAE